MVAQTRVHLHTLVLLIFFVQLSQPVCVDIPSDTDAVLGKGTLLTCISCMKREEVKTKTRVDWYYTPKSEGSASKIHILTHENDKTEKSGGPFKDRVTWNGSKDYQDVSIEISNVTYNDSGLYECYITRKFEFDSYTQSFLTVKNVTLKVKEKASEDPAALYSEIMMYVLLVFLTFWLLVEMVYCYRKISKADEQAQDTAY
ncbi:sodium channel regulatory subunit beta-3 isoform X2 [Echeneis naucrates]|uniref:Sodium channel regulatory subunit beta-3 n=1 Tax=Echeneis naucrates TaxID=173247 RepID=A0A665UM34_ECHNA|nr:sodium channel subunit beta-3 isoform X2 [Echeneis naucrates]